MKAEKIRGLDANEVQRQQQDAQEQLFRLRFQMGMGQSEGLKRYRTLRKDRARMLTILNEKRANGEVPQVTAPVAAKAAGKTRAGKKSK
ncbi:MAG: 50S ribosomal protein L29 [Bryobacteraceae bacterium]